MTQEEKFQLYDSICQVCVGATLTEMEHCGDLSFTKLNAKGADKAFFFAMIGLTASLAPYDISINENFIQRFIIGKVMKTKIKKASVKDKLIDSNKLLEKFKNIAIDISKNSDFKLAYIVDEYYSKKE